MIVAATTVTPPMREAAHACLRRGLSPIPVGRDKKPLVKWEAYQLEAAHADQVDEWWTRTPDANVGIVTGAVSGVVVLDADGPEGVVALDVLRVPRETWIARTGRGLHVYLRHPGGDVKIGNRAGLRPKLDVRGDGGYVIVPPSVHASGRMYEWPTGCGPDDVELAEIPAHVLELLLTPPAPTNGTAHGGDILAGQRNDTLYRVGRSLAAKGLTLEAVSAALLAENATRCRPPLSDREVRATAEHAFAQPHRPDFAPTTNGAHPPAPVLVNLANVKPEAVEWLWPGRIPRGKLALIIGEPGSGKTSVTLDMTARTSRGLAWPDAGMAPAGNSLLLTSEDGLADTVRPMIDRQRGDASRVHVLRAVAVDGVERTFTLERDLPVLEAAIRQTGALLVIISPLSAYLGAKDSYKDAEIRGLLTPLADLADRCRVAVVGIMHLTKAQTRRLLLRAQGSIAFVAQARTVFVVGEAPDTPGRRLFASSKNNLGREAPALAFRITDSGLAWEDEPIAGTADRLLAGDEAPTRTETRERDDAAQFLRDLLADGPIASRQVEGDAKANGISQRTLWRAKSDLGILADRARTQDGRTAGWYWRLPVEAP